MVYWLVQLASLIMVAGSNVRLQVPGLNVRCSQTSSRPASEFFPFDYFLR